MQLNKKVLLFFFGIVCFISLGVLHSTYAIETEDFVPEDEQCEDMDDSTTQPQIINTSMRLEKLREEYRNRDMEDEERRVRLEERRKYERRMAEEQQFEQYKEQFIRSCKEKLM